MEPIMSLEHVQGCKDLRLLSDLGNLAYTEMLSAVRVPPHVCDMQARITRTT